LLCSPLRWRACCAEAHGGGRIVARAATIPGTPASVLEEASDEASMASGAGLASIDEESPQPSGRRPPATMDAPVGFEAWPITARRALRVRKRKKRMEAAEGVADEVDDEAEEASEEPLLEMMELQAPLVPEADLLGHDDDVEVYMEVDLDRGLREEAAWLPTAEVKDSDSRGNVIISRTKVIEALLKRRRYRDVWERLPLEPAPWDRRDCPNPRGERVPTLAYGLESIVGMRGRIVPLALLPVEQRRGLRLVAQPEDIDPGAMPAFVPPWQDTCLQELAVQRSCRFFSSTSSLTGLLSKCYFAISRHAGVDTVGLSSAFRGRSSMHGPSSRLPTVVYLRRTSCGQAWSISAAPDAADEEDSNILLQLGLTMEQQMKMTKEAFDARFCRRRPGEPKGPGEEVSAAAEEEEQSYRFLEVGPFMMRSQLDAKHKDLIFDLKTRAAAPIRYDVEKYRQGRHYRIGKLLGQRGSYELELYDMMRLAFLKYGLQARIGRMDGIFVTYHNTAEVFGFQYIPLADMDRCVYGGREPALAAFDLSSKTLAAVLQLLTEDEDLAQTGTIKVMLASDPMAAAGAGCALDLAAAPVFAADTAAERLDTVRRWRVLVDVEGLDGKPHSGEDNLSQDLRVYLTAKEVIFQNREKVASGPWGSILDAFRRGPGKWLWAAGESQGV